MKRFLPAALEALDRNALLAFDFDGVLAPLVSRTSEVRMRPATRALLGALTRRAPCAVITGRALRDLRPIVRGLAFAELLGNHGAERAGRPAPELERLVRAWRRTLAPLAGRGVEIEDKRYSISLHYRDAPDRVLARRRLLTACRVLPGVRLVPGKCVINVVAARAPHKGDALRDLCRERRAPAAVFVGDDVTDEDVFALREPRWLTVRVGRSRASKARYFVDRQADVDGLLRALLDWLG